MKLSLWQRIKAKLFGYVKINKYYYVYCPKCKEWFKDTPHGYLSTPPGYFFRCPKCGTLIECWDRVGE